MRFCFQPCIPNIDLLATTECKEDAVPFLCLYSFPIYSCTDQLLLLPSKEECERISTTTCQAELQLVNQFQLGNLLPDCSELPSTNNAAGEHEALFS